MPVLDERAAVRRLYDRFGFGPKPGDLDAGFDASVGRMLDPAAAAADAGAQATPPPEVPPPPKPAKAGDRAARQQEAQQLQDQQRTVTTWWLDRMVAADVPSVERLTWFWHGHFATSEQKVRSPWQMLAQNQTFRRLGMGSFTDLAHSLIVDPAMLRWLDGNDNKVGAPNENLAREFMELFTLGAGHYSETDVREAARALTGWVVTPQATTALLQPKRHDSNPKKILGVTRNFTEQSFVDLVLSRPESPPFVVSRLWFRLVSATPPAPDVLTRLLAAYGPGRDIRSTLRAIAAEPAFHDTATTLVKQPVEWLAGLLRALAIRPSTLDPGVVQRIGGGLRAMGQIPFEPPNVGGWASGGSWLTTSAGHARLQLAQLIAGKANLDVVAKTATPNRPEAVRTLLGVDSWSDRTRAALGGVAGTPAQLVAIAACSPEYVVSA
jgi:uncharacterized protein (DUF1800 family)